MPPGAACSHELQQFAGEIPPGAYGQPVFDYLRDCRLELARSYPAQGV